MKIKVYEVQALVDDSMDTSLSKFWVIVKDREAWHAAVLGVSKSQIRLSECAQACGNYKSYEEKKTV